MPQPTLMTDDTLDAALNSGKPVLMVFSHGDLRGDFSSAFNKAADSNQTIAFVKLNVVESPRCAERFKVGSKSIMIGWHNGEEIVRRPRPWGTDVPLAVEMLEAAYQAQQSAKPQTATTHDNEDNNKDETNVTDNTKPLVQDHPVHVTDATFQQDVIDYSSEMPVLVDYWAAWCGPCRMVAPILDKLAQEYAGRVRIAKVDVDANPGLSHTFQIRSIPTIMAIKDRTIVFAQPGAFPEPAFRSLIDQLIALEVPKQEAEPEADPAE